MVEKIGSPTPSVVHLVTLFRQIANGEIRIPAFQRDYVWTEKQILGLLDSVFESYPIGSLLFWRVEKKALEVAPRDLTAFPEAVESYPLNYVLDGMQRLTTLYGVFHYEEGVTNPLLNIGFELRQKKFKSLSQPQRSDEIYVPMATLFTPRRLLEFQSKVSEMPDAEELIDAVLTLQAAFQDYMIPTVTIKSPDVERVVGIFERVNSTGTRLNSVDFMRAITWSSSFDLSKKIAEVSAEISDFGWSLRQDTIIKCVALVLGMDVSSESLLDLRDRNEGDLHEAFEEIVPKLAETSNLLDSSFGIKSPEVVSYEGQILVAFLLCHLGTADAVRDDFIRWFWSCGLNEQLRGKPDDYVVNLLSSWATAHETGAHGGAIQPSFTKRDFLTRRLLAKSAFTNTFKMLLAANRAHDLYTGEEISIWEYLSGSSTDHLVPVYHKAELQAAKSVVGDRVASAKLFCNCVLITANTDARSLSIRDRILTLRDKQQDALLASQFISSAAAYALEIDDVAGFAEERANMMSEFATSLLDTSRT